MALEKVQRYKVQLVSGLSSLIAFTIGNLTSLVLVQGLKAEQPKAYHHPADAIQNFTADVIGVDTDRCSS